MSVFYLALLSLLYLLITSNYLPASFTVSNLDNNNHNIFIEISQDGVTKVQGFDSDKALSEFKSHFDLEQDLRSGDSLTINGNEVLISKLSGRKKISLGIPIGLNSASSEDLQSIPGIGEELAARIINYREGIGKFDNIDELDNIEGIGKKKLDNIRTISNLD